MSDPVESLPGPDAQRRARLDEQAMAYELASENAVTGALASHVAAAAAGVLTAFTTSARAAGQAAARLFRAIYPQMEGTARGRARGARDLGRDQAALIASVERREWLGEDDPVVDAVLAGMDRKARVQLERAAFLGGQLPMATLADVNTVIGAAEQAVNSARADTRWLVNRQLNLGVDDVARQMGLNLMWVPERNACLHCLAYAGYVVEPGADFPAGRTFGDKPLALDPVPYPPLHPNCRCRAEPYDGEPGPPAETVSAMSVADALAREARRSVLRGLTDSASGPATARAAERLILRGAALPKTVVARARRDLKRGTFTDRPTGL